MAESFGKYELVRRLAFGGMAELFLAKQTGSQGFEKRVVVKRILPQFCADPAFVKMFIDEAVVAGRLSHPNVVQTYDFGEVDGVYYIAMEHVEGVDLRHLLRTASERQRLLTPAEVSAIGEGVARGLAYAHAFSDERLGPLGIVHRDVSPHNIMVSRAGDVKVMDFGIAKAVARATRTATGTIKGKVAYMAPEQAAGLPIDKRADQFALGLVLWECLTGRRVFDGESDMEMLRKVMACDVMPPGRLRPEVPAALDDVIMKMLAREPEGRFDDSTDAEQQLAGFRFSLGKAGVVRLGEQVSDVSTSARPRSTQPLEEAGADHGAAVGSEPTAVTVAPSGRKGDTEPAAADWTQGGEPGPEPRAEVESSEDGSPEAGRRSLSVPAMVGLVLALAAVALGLLLSRRSAETTGVLQATPVTTVAALEVLSSPAGAAIWVDGLDVGLRTPAVLPGLSLGGRPTVELRLAEHEVYVTSVELRSAQQTVTATLQRQGPSVIAVPAVPPAQAVEAPPAAAAHLGTGSQKGKGKAAAETTGRLSLRSLGPWVDVYLRGKKLGTTPLEGVVVPAGLLQLRLVNQAAGVAEVIDIEVAPGANAKRTVTPGGR